MRPVTARPLAAAPRLRPPLWHRWRPWGVAATWAIAGHAAMLHGLAGFQGRDTGSAPLSRLVLVPVRHSVPGGSGPPEADEGGTPARGRPGPTLPSVSPRVPARPVPGALRPAGSEKRRIEPLLGGAQAGGDTASGTRASPASPGPGDSPAAGAAPPAAAAAGATPPSYLADVPEAFTMRLVARRGEQSGIGQLRFGRDADGGYRLRLVLGLPRGPLLEMTSAGLSGSTGLAPERFTDRRLARGVAAANFDRAGGRVRFSARTDAAPIAPPAQDRLSWLVQLAAVVQADPALRRTGAEVLLQVVGARGGVQLWRFESTGNAESSIDAGDGPTGVLRFVREPELLYDNRVEVWLDPARRHLPVRVRFTLEPTQQRLEFWLADSASSD